MKSMLDLVPSYVASLPKPFRDILSRVIRHASPPMSYNAAKTLYAILQTFPLNNPPTDPLNQPSIKPRPVHLLIPVEQLKSLSKEEFVFDKGKPNEKHTFLYLSEKEITAAIRELQTISFSFPAYNDTHPVLSLIHHWQFSPEERQRQAALGSPLPKSIYDIELNISDLTDNTALPI